MNGTKKISQPNVYTFFDSGGKDLPQSQDPNGDNNWITWYQHGESFLLHLNNASPNTYGIKLTFNYLRINDDHLKIYEGDVEDPSKLIVDLTNNDYSKDENFVGFTVMSHGNMTIRFTSNSQYRDQGWDATIELATYTPQSPYAAMGICDSKIYLLPGSKAASGATSIYYTTDGSTPTSNSSEYSSTPITITPPQTVTAITVENGVSSAVKGYPFSSTIAPPDAPDITFDDKTNTVIIKSKNKPQNDTYYVRYTLNDDDPADSDAEYTEKKDADTIVLTKPCTINARVRGTTCPNKFSIMASTTVTKLKVTAPTITFDPNGSTTLACSFNVESPNSVVIKYTTDGSDPETSQTALTYSASFIVNPGTTVKAYAYVTGTDAADYEKSSVATDIYVPQSGSGVNGSVVLLDDREPHSWSYYSDGEQPVHSLNPADVKITYFGNGTNNISTTNGVTPANDSWTQNATTVQVSYNETQNTFIYLKTLERIDGITATKVEESTGRCEYTTIPNPFSRRPTYQYANGDLNRYCGFYAWRVKKVTGGKIYTAATGGSEIAQNTTINAETAVYFAPDSETGMEVELEALWARAYVVTTGGNNSNTAITSQNVGYERNFVVLAQNQDYRFGGSNNPRISNTDYAATVSRYYPDGNVGNANATVRGSNSITLEADTKFEYLSFSNTPTIIANNHYLCIGRGIPVSSNSGSIQGMGQASSNDLNYTIRVESGRFDGFVFIASSDYDMGGRVQIKSTLGCDYDRAKGENSQLAISRSSHLRLSTGGVAFTNSNNKDQKVFDCVVKSGTYQGSVTNNGTFEQSFYCGHNSPTVSGNNRHYPGIRHIIVEGGQLASLNGGRGTISIDDANTTYNPEVINFYARIKGGIFRGSVFGGAADNSSGGSRKIVITGGEIRGWVAGGSNGTNSGSYKKGCTDGNSYIYVGGDAIIGGPNATAVNGTNGGQVYGAGRGTLASGGNENYATGTFPQPASIIKSNVVIADNAKISNPGTTGVVGGNVYGGGNYGYLEESSNVYILGGTIQHNVYGGAYGNRESIPESNIIIKGGTIEGSVYGGSNEGGKVEIANVNISGGNISGNVYGAGLGVRTTQGSYTYDNIADETNVTINGGTIKKDVYGGGEQSIVTTNTTVTINNGTINDVYGGGYGLDGAAANVGKVTMEINGGTMNKVFGCNNLNGSPQGDVTVNFNGGTAVDVYGGGNLADYTTAGKYPVVYLTNGTVKNNVYGGGSMAKVNSTVVNVTGGRAYNVFAGAEGQDSNALVLGNKTLNMQGGDITNVYGGSFSANDRCKSFVNISGGHVQSHVFGSGYFGDTYGDCYVYIGKNAIENAPNNAENSEKLKADGSKYDIKLDNLTPIWIENNVYAGANWGSYTGTFGAPTIKKPTQGDGGHSNIYIDGEGYDITSGKNSNYIVVDGSIYGSGTSCDAGVLDNSVIIRNYGYMDEVDEVNTILRMTRNLKSIQRVKDLVLDNSSINFVGQGNIASNDPTVEYGILNITNIVRATNNSNISLSKPLEQVHKLGSYTCTDVYAANPTYTAVPYNADRDVKSGVVINEGGYLMVCEEVNNTKVYGELEGFFNMQEPNSDGINNEGYIFARPKYIANEGNSGLHNNPATYSINANDGGFVDFAVTPTRNVFDINGNKAPEQQGYMQKVWNGSPVQMAYTNKTAKPQLVDNVPTVNPNDYRFWRYKPSDVPTSTREVMFVVKAEDDADDDAFLTTTGYVNLPPAIGDDAVYYIKELHWGIDGKDCYAVNSAIKEANGSTYIQADGNKFNSTNTTNNDADDYYANPNSSFGFVMDFSGDCFIVEEGGYEQMVLSNESFNGYFVDHALATLNSSTTDMPKLDFIVTYSNRLSQNEMWAEAMAVIDEYDPNDMTEPVQRIYLYISVSTMTRMGQNVETSVYASTAYDANKKDRIYTYKASLTLPTFMKGNKGLYATFDVGSTDKTHFNTKEGENNTVVPIVSGVNMTTWYSVENTTGMALRIYATDNDDNTNGWTHKGKGTNDVNTSAVWDFEAIPTHTTADSCLGAADGRTYTTVKFELRYDPEKLSAINELKMGQHYLGYVTLQIPVDNVQGTNGEVTGFTVTVHVYVTGTSKYFYLDGKNGRDGYSGMFPDQAKKTFSGVLNTTGYTVQDPIFVVGGVTPEQNSGLTWDADRFLNAVTVEEEDLENYTEEELRQLSQVKVYRYPGGHYLSDGTTGDANTNKMYDGSIIDVQSGSRFIMKNVCISGGSELYNLPETDDKKSYNPNNAKMETNYPLISITGEDDHETSKTVVTIENSTLINNNNISDDNLASAIYNNGGTLNVDGITIKNNSSKGYGTGVYQNGIMNLGNTQTITIADQIYLTDGNYMDIPKGLLYDDSRISDVMVEIADNTVDVPSDPNPSNVNISTSITRYSGRVIARYAEEKPEAPAFGSYLPDNHKVFGRVRKAAPAYESEKYGLDDELIAEGRDFKIANGADPEVLPYIASEMKTQYDPTYHDLILANVNANLPVELLYFHATCMGDAVQFEWATASETNNEYFTIERSSDAVNYEEVARIQGAGTTSQRSDYSFMADNNSSSMTYYRLRQTDIDGAEEVFSPVALQCTAEQATVVDIYPVPARDIVNIVSMG
ncbi:MAG: chitobiase/beta-hexosaminidase C-terminal domain-containing protein, partial [Bacteroidales bacterium]|nr:chitobiase/beta-hexosaminidase C-terminal domain-containing protein [Bacteroidales bacterium]